MKNITILLLLTFAFSVFGVRIYKGIILKQNVTGYLKRAADANTIDLASQELSKALNYLEANNITSGYTSILYRTPDDDVEFWYQNLKASHLELGKLTESGQLERTNVLLKLRETLVDSDKKTKVTGPNGLSVFPNNKLWGVLMSLAVFALFAGFILLGIKLEHGSKK